MTNPVRFRGDGDRVEVDIAATPGTQAVFTVYTVNAAIDNGQYWTFSTLDRDYHVWYNTPGDSGNPQDPGRPFLGGLTSVGIPVTFPSSTIASTVDAAQATVLALNKLTGELHASLVNNSTVQVSLKGFGDVTDAADVTAGVTITIDASGIARSVIVATYVITGSGGLVNDLAQLQQDSTFDLHGSTYNILSVNDFSACGAQVVGSATDPAVKSDNLVASNTGFGGLGSAVNGVN
jgi:hypothetical protein